MRQINLLSVLGFVCLLGACGGNGGDGDRMPVAAPDPEAPPDPPPDTGDRPPDTGMVSGQFKDANVSGLAFESGSHVGITDANGGFTCDSGQEINFSVGAVVLGSSSCTEVVTPLSLFPGATLDTPEVLNVVRFLLMLDADGNATNGIEISDAVQLRAENWGPVDFAAADLDAELAPIRDDLADVDLRDLPDAREARAHLLETTINLTDSMHATAVRSLLNWWADDGYDYVYEGTLQDGRLTLTSAEGDTTLTGTADLKATPPTITATWNDSTTGATATYTTYGCRLN